MRRGWPKRVILCFTSILLASFCFAQTPDARKKEAKSARASHVDSSKSNAADAFPTPILYRCADSPTCDSPQDLAFESAREADLQSSDPDVIRAAKAYTKGVTVAFGDPGPGMQSSTRHDIRGDKTSPNGLRAIENVLFRPQMSEVELEAALGHEGSHVADAQDFVRAITPEGKIDQSKNVSAYRTEFRAYLVTDAILAAHKVRALFGNCEKSKPCVLGAGVELARVAETINQLLASPLDGGSVGSGYGLTPQHPGPAIYEILTPPYLIPHPVTLSSPAFRITHDHSRPPEPKSPHQ